MRFTEEHIDILDGRERFRQRCTIPHTRWYLIFNIQPVSNCLGGTFLYTFICFTILVTEKNLANSWCFSASLLSYKVNYQLNVAGICVVDIMQ